MGQDFPLSPIAVYLHNPFCLRPCPYCSFYRVAYHQKQQAEYLGLLIEELKLWKREIGRKISAKSVYFGGGTPALLTAEGINNILQEMHLEPDAEITLEINPIQITPTFVQELQATAVNRISLGVQSFDDEMLRLLGRRHHGSDIPAKMELLRDAGYENISLDLLYGLPAQTPEMLRTDIEELLKQKPQHISTYLLTLDEDSPMLSDIESGKIPHLANDDLAADMYELVCELLTEAGYTHYEISNFALPGYESRHNLSYWHSEPYLALGASASGWLPPWRYDNPASIRKHQNNIRKQVLMPHKKRRQGKAAEEDYLMMGLRLTQGIDRADFERRFGRDVTEGREKTMGKLLFCRMIELDDNWLRLSESALFISNVVIGELMWR